MKTLISKNIKNLKLIYCVYSAIYFIYVLCELIYESCNNYPTDTIIYLFMCNLLYLAVLMVGIYGIVKNNSKVFNLVLKIVLIYEFFILYRSCFSGILSFDKKEAFIVVYNVIIFIASLIIATCAVLWFVNYFKKDAFLLDLRNLLAVIYIGFLLLLFILSFVLVIKYYASWVYFIDFLLRICLVFIFILATNKEDSLSE